MKTKLACAALAFAANAALAGITPPDELVKTVMLDMQRTIVQDKDLKGGDRAKTMQVIEQKALPYFNYPGMAALAVGVNWRKATPEQKKRLAEEFRTLLVRTYASSLSSFGDQQFEFRPLRLKPDDTDVTVQVRVLQPGSQPVVVEYDMEKTPEGWKCYDVRVAGISLVVNYRTEFSAIVRDKGIDGLIATLETKNKSLEAAEAKK
ncbi:MAG: ABC transporter substrate-binding protein [Betaproteobacteria bacterium]|nr:ABC transporter substrate-binding protein [Betaproteobacteria bacterium]